MRIVGNVGLDEEIHRYLTVARFFTMKRIIFTYIIVNVVEIYYYK